MKTKTILAHVETNETHNIYVALIEDKNGYAVVTEVRHLTEDEPARYLNRFSDQAAAQTYYNQVVR